METNFVHELPHLHCYGFNEKECFYEKNKNCHNLYASLELTSEFIKIIRFLQEHNLEFSEDENGRIYITH